MLCTASARFATAPLARPAAATRRSLRRAALTPKAVAFPTDSEDVKDLLKGKTTELQGKAGEAASWAQAKWEASENKPALVATGGIALFSLYIVSGVLSTVDRLPLIHTIFELLGLSVSVWFAYRWFFVAGERELIIDYVTSLAKKIGVEL